MDNLGALKRGVLRLLRLQRGKANTKIDATTSPVCHQRKQEGHKGCKAVEDEPELWAEVNTADTCTLDLARECIEVEEE